MKKNSVIVLFSCLLCALVICVMAAALLLITKPEEVKMENYTVVVADEITLYKGDEYTLMPYLVYKDGSLANSLFEYKSSDSGVNVTGDGVLTVVGDTSGKVTVRVLDRNTSAFADVNVNVVSKLTNVLGITFRQGDVETLVNGKQTLGLGQSYAINVVTEPHNIQIKDYCTIKTVDKNGVEKQTMNVTYSGNKVQVSPVGLGNGTIKISVKNDDSAEIFSSDIEFTIETPGDAEIGRQILKSENAELLSKAELDKIERVTLDESVTSLTPLAELPSLKTVVFSSGNVMGVTGISDGYCYRVKRDIFRQYEQDERWSQYFTNILPYEQSADELYVVYHDSRNTLDGEDKSLKEEKYGENVIRLLSLTDTGYKHTSWLDEKQVAYTLSDLMAITENGIHLFAEWQPIKYTVVYHVSDSQTSTRTAVLTYDEWVSLPLCSAISDKKITGYKFAGWSKNGQGDQYEAADYPVGEECRNLKSEEGAIVDLYDRWEPIVYSLRYDLKGIEGDEIETKELKYGEIYVIPKGNARGYTFVKWSLASGEGQRTFAAGDEISMLTETDGEVLVLVAEWDENSYTVNFDFNSGTTVSGASGLSPKTVKYTDPVQLPELVKTGYPEYSWFADLDGNGALDENEPTYVSGATVSRVASEGNVYLRAVWSQGKYSVTYNLGTSNAQLSGNAKINNEYGYSDKFTLPGATRTGYILDGWRSSLDGKIYAAGVQQTKLVADNGGSVTFSAVWRAITYTVHYNVNGGNALSVTEQDRTRTYDIAFGLPTVTRTGYTFAYWEINNASYTANASVKNLTSTDKAVVTVTAVWKPIKYKIIRSDGDQGSHVNLRYTAGVSDGKADCDATVKFQISTKDHSCALESVTWSGGTITPAASSGTYSFKMPAGDVTIKVKCTTNHCIVAGSLITLADGSQKAVEELTGNEMLLVWNMLTGTFDAAPILFIDSDPERIYEVITLKFSDATEVKVIYEHAFWDFDLNEYVFLRSDAAKYIGHWFNKQVTGEDGELSWTKIQLVGVTVAEERTTAWSPVTYGHLCYYVNGMLSMPGATESFINIFEVNPETMAYDKEAFETDIATYGLFTYEEFAELLPVPEEVFNAFGGQYLKVAIGKGLTDIQSLAKLFEHYQDKLV